MNEDNYPATTLYGVFRHNSFLKNYSTIGPARQCATRMGGGPEIHIYEFTVSKEIEKAPRKNYQRKQLTQAIRNMEDTLNWYKKLVDREIDQKNFGIAKSHQAKVDQSTVSLQKLRKELSEL